MSDALWFNKDPLSDPAEPAYTAAELRRAMTMLMFGGVADRLGARGGVRPGTVPASISGETWTVHNTPAVVYPGLTNTAGAYLVGHEETSGNIDPADGSNPRVDALDLQVQDDDEDLSGFRRAHVVYTAGVPGSGSAPAQVANSVRLATIDVPTSGTGSPTLTVVAPWTVASGGILPVRDSSERPTSGLYNGLGTWNEETRRPEFHDNGSWWVPHEEVDNSIEVAGPIGLTGSFANLVTVNVDIPSHWGSWKCFAMATWRTGGNNGGMFNVLLTIAGVHQQIVNDVTNKSSAGETPTHSIGGRRTGITSNGSQPVHLRAAESSLQVSFLEVFLYARAVRTG